MQISNSINDYEIYGGPRHDKILGVGIVTLPDIVMVTDEITGSGIAGRANVPIVGHTEDLNVTIDFRTMTDPAIGLMGQRGQIIAAFLDLQNYDNVANDFTHIAEKVFMRSFPKGINLGKAEVGAKGDVSVSLMCYYIAVHYAGVKQFEHDKFSRTFIVNGTDYLAPVRANTSF